MVASDELPLDLRTVCYALHRRPDAGFSEWEPRVMTDSHQLLAMTQRDLAARMEYHSVR